MARKSAAILDLPTKGAEAISNCQADGEISIGRPAFFSKTQRYQPIGYDFAKIAAFVKRFKNTYCIGKFTDAAPFVSVEHRLGQKPLVVIRHAQSLSKVNEKLNGQIAFKKARLQNFMRRRTQTRLLPKRRYYRPQRPGGLQSLFRRRSLHLSR